MRCYPSYPSCSTFYLAPCFRWTLPTAAQASPEITSFIHCISLNSLTLHFPCMPVHVYVSLQRTPNFFQWVSDRACHIQNPRDFQASVLSCQYSEHHGRSESGSAWHSNCPQATSQAQFAMPQGSLLFFRAGLEVAASPTSRVQEEAADAHRVMHHVLGAKGG